jgi:hypothetical protein
MKENLEENLAGYDTGPYHTLLEKPQAGISGRR